MIEETARRAIQSLWQQRRSKKAIAYEARPGHEDGAQVVPVERIERSAFMMPCD